MASLITPADRIFVAGHRGMAGWRCSTALMRSASCPPNSHVLPALIRRFHEAALAMAASVTCWGTKPDFAMQPANPQWHANVAGIGLLDGGAAQPSSPVVLRSHHPRWLCNVCILAVLQHR
jgi:hypothetical protein